MKGIIFTILFADLSKYKLDIRIDHLKLMKRQYNKASSWANIAYVYEYF